MAEPGADARTQYMLTIGMLSGREFLTRELESLGVGDADTVVTRILDAATADQPLPSDDDLAALANAIERGMGALLEADPGLRPIVDDTIEATDELTESIASSDRRHTLRNAAAAIGVLLMIAKLHVEFDWRSGDPTRLTIELQGGVPDGFRPLVAPLVGLMAAAGKDAGRADSDGPGGSSASRRTGAGAARLSGQGPGRHQARLPRHPTSFQQGLEMRDEILDFLSGREQEFAAMAAAWAPGDIFEAAGAGPRGGAPTGTGSYPVFSSPIQATPEWPFNTDITFGAGLLLVAGEEPGQDLFRPAIRIQSRERIKPTVLRLMSDYLKETLTPLVSLRWISPVITLSGHYGAGFGPWRGPVPKDGRIASGAPLNVAGRGHGACTAIFCDNTGAQFALTAGHTIRDTGRGIVPYTSVYCPPQPPTPTPGAEIGTVQDGDTFDRFRPGQPIGAMPRRADFALIKLNAGAAPSPANLANGRALSQSVVSIPVPTAPGASVALGNLFGLKVGKSHAKTSFLPGYVNAIEVRLNCIDRTGGGAVMAHGLVEVVLDSNASGVPAPGDSGAMLSTLDDTAPPRPLGITFAAAQTASPRAANHILTQSIYGIPISSVGCLSNLRIA